MPDQPVLTARALNRALLARQHLLDRAGMPAAAMIEHLVGMQAQVPQQPYIALWSRLRGFDATELERLLLDREAVRIPTLRTTIHLHTAHDALWIRPLLQPVLEKVFRTTSFGKATAGVDVGAVLDAGREMLDGRSLAASELAARLAERWPGRHGPSMAQAVHYLMPVLQPTPRGLWTATARPSWTTVEGWLGRALADPIAPDELVLRYLAAFGPAGVADARTWSWLTGLREVFERLRPELVAFRDERGRELFDVPDGPRPDPDLPAPPRFLPEYDNIALSHDDRRRIVAPEAAGRITGWVGTFTVDGFISGQWRLERDPSRTTLVLDPFVTPTSTQREELVGEAERLLGWAAPSAARRSVEFGVARQASSRG